MNMTKKLFRVTTFIVESKEGDGRVFSKFTMIATSVEDVMQNLPTDEVEEANVFIESVEYIATVDYD